MPTISTFYGILIQMFWNDHAPPHFHALYAEYEALIDIHTLEVLEGKLPRRALALVLVQRFINFVSYKSRLFPPGRVARHCLVH